jgi:tRNA (guanine37-N1)-methyltransferase
MFEAFREYGIVKRAIQQNKINVVTVNIRNFARGRHLVVDDRPFGGGCGMVMKPEPLAAAIRNAEEIFRDAKKILLTPQGRVFDQKMAKDFSSLNSLIFVCGRYEGIDERVNYNFIDEEVSIGDYILTGGELAAMVIIEAVSRLIPGALGGEDSAENDSFADNLLEHAQYTRPREFEGEKVPEKLLSGNHKDIEQWRFESSLIRTFLKRRDLLIDRPLRQEEIIFLKKWRLDIERLLQAQCLSGVDPLSGG